MIEVKKQYIKAVDEYMEIWCRKHSYTYNSQMWVGDDIGGIYMEGDMFVDFRDVRYDIDNNLSEKTFEEWYWYNRELDDYGSETYVALSSYSKGYRPYTEEQIEEIRKTHEKISELRRKLEELVKNA